MIVSLVILLFISCNTISSYQHHLSLLSGQNLVNYVNSAQDLYVAEDSDVSYPVMEAKFAKKKDSTSEDVLTATRILSSLPESFDSREHWPNCSSIQLIRDQDHCGSCWAFAIAEVISDRTCISSKGSDRPVLSAEDILSCCGEQCGYGCHGGWPIEALKWWNSNGVVTGGDYNGTGCRPYSIAPCTEDPCEIAPTPECQPQCQKGYDKSYQDDKRHGATVYQVDDNHLAIMSDIFQNGPVEATFQVYEDLYKYRHGIYHHVAGKHLGGHAVKIIGWGRDKDTDTDYWLIANSWGVHFGERGFMRIRRGTNECGIEGNVVAGRPGLGIEGSGEEEEEADLGSIELQFL